MTVKELIEKLNKFDPALQIMILDPGCCLMDCSGLREDEINEHHEEDSGDCEGRAGEKVVMLIAG